MAAKPVMQSAAPEQSGQRPNILLILTDQQRLSAAGCYGETPCQTPAIDALARSGVRFETAYTPCPLCSPARASIMTGLYPHTHGVCANVHDLGCSVNELDDVPSLLSRRLLASGYRCGYAGKWHLGSDAATLYGAPNRPRLPMDVGFEGQSLPGHGHGGFRYAEYQAYLAEHGYRHNVRQLKAAVQGMLYGVLDGPVEATVDYWLAQNTIGLIDRFRYSRQPFFIWHNFWGPHTPYYAPMEFYDLYRDVEIPPWPNFRWPAAATPGPWQVLRHALADSTPWADWAEVVRHYYASTSLIDSQIGRILRHLDETGLSDNTVVVFASDHGETLGSHGGMRDKGFCHWEEIQRIPLIVRLPARFATARRPGDVLPQWASLLDLYPTVLELAGARRDEETAHGLSLLPLLRGQSVPWRDSIFVEFHGLNHVATTMVTARHANIKYGWTCSSVDELYDLANDPHEMTNRIADPAYAGVVADMRRRMEAWMVETRFGALAYYRRNRLGASGWLLS